MMADLPVTVRETCGTLEGARQHLAAGEPQCGWCRRAEATAALIAEATSPPPRWFPDPLAPVTAERARLNRNVLDAEVLAYELEHGRKQGAA
jgi:hypothetical protein